MTPQPDGAQPPVEVRTVADPAALKALADPLRLRMLQLLTSDPDRLWTVKELAAETGQPATKLYHHMKLLEAAALVIDADTRLVSGIVEHRYRSAQRSIKLDDALFSTPAMREDSVRSLIGLLDRTRDDVVAYATGGGADFERISVNRALVRLTEEEHAEVTARLEELVDDVVKRHRGRKGPAIGRSAITVVVHPVRESER